MKILYSQIKELIPELSAPASEIAEVLTMTGFMRDSFEEVRFKNKTDYLIGLEIRQNRPDCLSVIGIAREVASYYGLKLSLPVKSELNFVNSNLDIKIKDQKAVHRVLALQIKNLQNQESSQWLKEFLSFYDLNSINLLVDLSNYVMIYTGYTSHLLDVDKIAGGIEWKVNSKTTSITTLDDTEVELNSGELIISDQQKVLALAGLVGCQSAAISMNTNNIIVEMAIYDHSLIMRNSRALSIVTEASNRLSKDLALSELENAFYFLTNLLLEYGQGEIASSLFNYYPHPEEEKNIILQPELISKIAGVDISKEKVVEVLENLRFKVEDNNEDLKITVPTDRTDIALPEDLAEEVIRLLRFDSLPITEVPAQEVVKDITPKIYFFKEKIRDFLTAQGWDEVLTQPLVEKNLNQRTNWQDWQEVTTQNSVNEEYPDLRQSIAVGLLNQLDSYLKKNIDYIQIFEIGKVFGQKKEKYLEQDNLGILWHKFSQEKKLPEFKAVIEKLLRSLGLSDFNYQEAEIKPEIANPFSVWKLSYRGNSFGIIYKLKPVVNKQTTYYCELNLEKLLTILSEIETISTIEITKKIVVLDVNLEFANQEELNSFLQKIEEKIGQDKLWSIEIIDEYVLDNKKIKYTVRVSYQELSDQEAKQLHAHVFDL